MDYEASLVGNVVIGRATGGLTKVRHCGYLYEWLDISDRAGEANAFFWQIKAAVDTYRHNPDRHAELIRLAMNIDASWDKSANQYVDMYRYGLLAQQWLVERHRLTEKFAKSLKKDRELFAEFFMPALDEYRDNFDWELKNTLKNS